MPTNRGMDKVVVYIYNGILLSHKKNEIMPFAATWMDLEIVIVSEVSQTEKDKYYMISLSVMPSRSMHVVTNGKLPFFFVAK